MRKITHLVLTALILVCSILQPLRVEAAEVPDLTIPSSLTLEYSSNGNGFAGLDIQIYRVAAFSEDGDYDLTGPFAQLPVKIHGITSQKEWRDAANTLASYIAAEKIPPTATGKTDATGKVVFSNLEIGIYLVFGFKTSTQTHIYSFENFCVFLPTPQDDGTLNYDVTAKPKYTLEEIPNEPVQYQVVKLWKDSGATGKRPQSITVDILKNGKVQETVKLNSQNNWSYSWKAPAGDDVWTVAEKDVPDAYTVVITTSGTTFTITNTRPASPGDPPKTGDSFALRPWLAVMCLSGMMLVVCGMLQKRKRG